MDDLSNSSGRIPEKAIDAYLNAIKSLDDAHILAGVEVYGRSGDTVDRSKLFLGTTVS